MAKRYFIVSYENEELLEDLSDTQISELFKALFRYAISGTEIDTEDKLLRCAFKIFRKSIDASNKKYDEICRRNAENGAKGGRPKKETEEPDEIPETQNNPKNPVGFSETQTNPDEPKKANTNTSTNTNTNTKQKQIDNTGDKSPEPPESVGDSGKAEKKAKKSESAILTEIIQAYTSNPELQDALQEFIKVRNKIKKPITKRGLKSALKTLDSLATTDEWKIATVDNAIEHCWYAFYETPAPMNGGNVNGGNQFNFGTTLSGNQ